MPTGAGPGVVGRHEEKTIAMLPTTRATRQTPAAWMTNLCTNVGCLRRLPCVLDGIGRSCIALTFPFSGWCCITGNVPGANGSLGGWNDDRMGPGRCVCAEAEIQ